MILNLTSDCQEYAQNEMTNVSSIPSFVVKVSQCFKFLGKPLPVAIPIRHRVKNLKVPGVLSSENFKRSNLEIFSMQETPFVRKESNDFFDYSE